MKKLILAVFLVVAGMEVKAQAQTLDDVFNEFKSKPGVEYQVVNPKMLESMNLDQKAKKELESIDSLQVLDLSKSDSLTNKKFEQVSRNINFKGFETMVNSNDDGEMAKIYYRTKDKSIKELVIINIEKGGKGQLVRIFGNIDPSKIHDMMHSNK
jgi:hypothetical protein